MVLLTLVLAQLAPKRRMDPPATPDLTGRRLLLTHHCAPTAQMQPFRAFVEGGVTEDESREMVEGRHGETAKREGGICLRRTYRRQVVASGARVVTPGRRTPGEHLRVLYIIGRLPFATPGSPGCKGSRRDSVGAFLYNLL
ncbi:hypothetical protein V492_05370 [Pseudogymnoascus sp. VKM F-4246]|nr:hypothetical protein V492_05370 [Pseudogymnoascus sp. VKM F-4246]